MECLQGIPESLLKLTITCANEMDDNNFTKVYALYQTLYETLKEPIKYGDYISSKAASIWWHAIYIMPPNKYETSPLLLQYIHIPPEFSNTLYKEIPIAHLPLSVTIDYLVGMTWDLLVIRKPRNLEYTINFYHILYHIKHRCKVLITNKHTSDILDIKELCYPTSQSNTSLLKVYFGDTNQDKNAVTEVNPSCVYIFSEIFGALERALFNAKRNDDEWSDTTFITENTKEFNNYIWNKLKSVNFEQIKQKLIPFIPKELESILHVQSQKIIVSPKPEQIILAINDSLLKEPPKSFNELLSTCTSQQFDQLVTLVYDTKNITYCPIRGLYKKGKLTSPKLVSLIEHGERL